jgi:hypothetical protein
LAAIWDPRLGYWPYRKALADRIRRDESIRGRARRERLAAMRACFKPRRRKRWVYPSRVLDCQSGRFVAVWRNRVTGEVWRSPYRCHSFRCRRCGPKRGREDAADIAAVLASWGESGTAAAYVVLTFRRDRFLEGFAGRMQCWEELPRAWNRLRHRLRRRGLLGPYFTVMEGHRDGWPHVNVVMAGSLGDLVRAGMWRQARRLLLREAKASGFGFQLWMDQRPATRKLANYLASYLTKPKQVPHQGPRGLHRVRYSREVRLAVRAARDAREKPSEQQGDRLEFCGLQEIAVTSLETTTGT